MVDRYAWVARVRFADGRTAQIEIPAADILRWPASIPRTLEALFGEDVTPRAWPVA